MCWSWLHVWSKWNATKPTGDGQGTRTRYCVSCRVVENQTVMLDEMPSEEGGITEIDLRATCPHVSPREAAISCDVCFGE